MTNYDLLSDEAMLMLAKGIDNPLIQSMARALENVMQITEERKRHARLQPGKTPVHGSPQADGDIQYS